VSLPRLVYGRSHVFWRFLSGASIAAMVQGVYRAHHNIICADFADTRVVLELPWHQS
jgi:hypothetical protein